MFEVGALERNGAFSGVWQRLGDMVTRYNTIELLVIWSICKIQESLTFFDAVWKGLDTCRTWDAVFSHLISLVD